LVCGDGGMSLNPLDILINDVADLKRDQQKLEHRLDAIQNDLWEVKALLGMILEKVGKD
jgi:hypothetical protein